MMPPAARVPQPSGPQQEIEDLKAESQALAGEQMAEIQRRIEELGK